MFILSELLVSRFGTLNFSNWKQNLRTKTCPNHSVSPSRQFFPLVPSITKHPVCIEPTMNARRSYRFHNRRDKNSSSLVVPSLVCSFSFALSFVFLSPQGSLMEQARPTFDRTKDYRPDSLTRNLPFPSKIDSREPPLSSLLQFFFPFTLPPSCHTHSTISSRWEEGLRTTMEGCLSWPALSCVCIQRTRTNYRKLVHFLRRLGISSDVRITTIVSPYCPSSSRHVFLPARWL